MLRRIAAILVFAFLPAGALALSPAPVRLPPYTITSAVVDQVAKSGSGEAANKSQGLLGYTINVHDSQYQYSLALCANVTLVDIAGHTIEPTLFNAGDTVVVSVRANAAPLVKECVERVVRQSLSQTASEGECLQGFQVKHEVVDASRLFIGTEYTYQLTIYARPTLDCDADSYGASPITTTVAASKPFVATMLDSDSATAKELTRWSLNTDTAGKATFSFTAPAQPGTYHFQVASSVAAAGDAVGWNASIVDPHPSPSPATQTSNKGLNGWAIAIPVIIIVLGAGAAEYWHWTIKRRRAHELPEEEYRRISRF
jgi:hypothetical protein